MISQCCMFVSSGFLSKYQWHFVNSVQFFSCSVVSNSLWFCGLQHARFPSPSLTPGPYSKSCPLSQWCHPTISFSVTRFSFLQSCPASGSFQVSQLFASGGQSIGASTSASVLPMNIQDWFLLGWTGRISLKSKGLSRVFSSTTVWKHKIFGAQPSLWSNSHLYMTIGKTIALTIYPANVQISHCIKSVVIFGSMFVWVGIPVSPTHWNWLMYLKSLLT